MNTRLVTIIVVVVLVAAGLFLTRSDDRDKKVSGLAGEVALSPPAGPGSLDPDMTPPDFFIVPESGKTTRLSDLRGKPVLINFWNTWCPPCREEMPGLDRLYREYADQTEFIFINILAGEKSVRDVTSFLADNGYSIPVYLDRQGEVAGIYGVSSIPATVVLDSDGEVVYAAAGSISYDQAKSLITR